MVSCGHFWVSIYLIDQTRLVAGSSSPLAYPSSSPAKAKTPRRRPNAMDSDLPLDSEPLDFPSYVHHPLTCADTDHHEGVLLLLFRHP